MTARRDRQELREALHEAEDDGVQDRHRAFLSGRTGRQRAQAPRRRSRRRRSSLCLLAACRRRATARRGTWRTVQASYGEIVRQRGHRPRCVRARAGGAGGRRPVRGASSTSTAPRVTAGRSTSGVEPGTVQWSPDGSMVAFDGRVDRMSGFDSDVRVLDVASGEIVTIADDGGDDPGGPQDLLPVWVDEDRLAFLRDRERAAPAGARRGRWRRRERRHRLARAPRDRVAERRRGRRRLHRGGWARPDRARPHPRGGRGPGDRRGHRPRCGDRRHERGRRPGGRHQRRRRATG